jgi:hypothetical protein
MLNKVTHPQDSALENACHGLGEKANDGLDDENVSSLLSYIRVTAPKDISSLRDSGGDVVAELTL